MKANELRIGNYIQATHEVEIDRGNGIIEDAETELILRVRGIDEDAQLIDGSCIFSLEEIGTDYQLDRYHNIEPIPLTEQWLLDFGFEVYAESSICKGWFIGENPITNDYMFTITWMKKENGELDECFYKNGYHVIKYIHQLQNLYFVLTGEELILKKDMDS